MAGTAAVLLIAASAWGGAALARPLSLWWCIPTGFAILGVGAAAGSGARTRGVERSSWHRVGSRLAIAGAAAMVVALAASALAADAWAGLDGPLPSEIDARVELVGDPRPTRFGVRAEVRAGGRLWDLTASGEAAGVLGGLRAGESAVVSATTRRREADDRWRASRHVVGIATARSVGGAEPASGPWRVANAIHRALLRSTAHLPADSRGVALGVALGDRGAIGALLAEDLRAAGLSHLTAVSGQHVVLLIAMAGPLLRHLPTRTAVVATAALLAGFVLLTRGEPSVLRAATMALVVTAVRAGGRQAVGLRVLAVVVAGLILIDPLIVWSVGFQLSVAATAGIAVGARRLAAAIPGPRPIAAALGVSLAAQTAVAPLVIASFGTMPLVGLGANLAVAPVIGPLMGWTLAAGTLAGVVPDLAAVLHTPTALLAGWVARVATWSAQLGIPGLRPPQRVWPSGLALLALGAVVVAGWRLLCRRGGGREVAGDGPVGASRWLSRVAPVGVGGVVAVLLAAGGASPLGRHELGVGAEAVVGEDRVALIVDGRAAPAAVVGGLRRLDVQRVDVVVQRTSSDAAAALTALAISRAGPAEVIAPARTAPTGVGAVEGRREFSVGEYTVVVTPDGADRLDVVVRGPEAVSGPE
jgi:competence protein ComEC